MNNTSIIAEEQTLAVTLYNPNMQEVIQFGRKRLECTFR